ncbi:MAG: cyclic nucleotide-binding domain-containing protein, partial [Xanthomonadales bacterium]|nr:cyclic nucleotide-binding domain-containing protein [Xanthomonadales bacterium]
ATGELICHEEDPCDALFLIETGRVQVISRNGGHQPETTELCAGDAFGELALVTGLPPIARAEAVEHTVAWEIHKDDFKEVVAVSPGLQQTLKRLSRNHRAAASGEVLDPERSRAWLEAAGQHLESELGDPTEADIVRVAHHEARGGSNVALAIWLGIALDGVPESLVIGGSMEGAKVSLALVGGLFLANFPESMSSAVVMKKQGTRNLPIIIMWMSLMIMTAVGAAFGNVFIADAPHHLHGLLEGMAAGAMLAMIAQTMLPEAYDHGGWLTGLMTVSGFLAAIWMGML